MKTKIIISLLGLLFIAGDFVGSCDEELEPKPDYIIVNVLTKGSLLFKSPGSIVGTCIDTTKNVPIRVDVTEGGGEQSNFFLQTSDHCEFATETVTIRLYREQQIEIKQYLIIQRSKIILRFSAFFAVKYTFKIMSVILL